MMIGMISLILLSNPATSLKLNIEPKLGKNESDQTSLRKPEEKGKPTELSKQGFEEFCIDIPNEKKGFTLVAGLCASCIEDFEDCISFDDSKYWDFKVNMTVRNEMPVLARQLRNQRLQYMLRSSNEESQVQCFKKLKRCTKELIAPLMDGMGVKNLKYTNKLMNKMNKAYDKWGIDVNSCWDIIGAFWIFEEYKWREEHYEKITKCRDPEKWPKVDSGIWCDGCTALVKIDKFDTPSCATYCESFGHSCVRAAQDYHDTCMPYWDDACDWEWVDTSDVLCTCERSSAAAEGTSAEGESYYYGAEK